ncbi:hypothetical protein J2S43_000741 [Catenuloplanes nepalensis]|uniref:UDP-N-acetyl-alpha-D-muramoyl-L-alanyl-L-glutamate epimerase n=1 Tax=Catenuloplanes nepalensis TaxID=587533 RepID=A0ABT9MLF5_9ACTN|nr:hypothetical protein [Catenuloplanes nepalensis]
MALSADEIRGRDLFTAEGYHLDVETGVVELHYALTGPGVEPLRFTETVTLPVPETAPGEDALARTHRVLELLLIAAGVSYYKVAAPARIALPHRVGAKARAFATAVYTKGMGEFAYRNELPHVLTVAITPPDGEPTSVPAHALDLDLRPLSAVGGGKDSIVTLEALRNAGREPVPFSVNPNGVIKAVNAASGLVAREARRKIDPLLFEVNKAGALNGHVPVTAVNSLIAVATAAFNGLGPVVMSNERSASDPNLVWHGVEINHQWSKGVEAEGLLRDALAEHAGLTNAYFSLLRRLSELHIARLYAETGRYDDVVTSCNRAFLLHNATARWCGDCPKCRFVFLAMAPSMSRDRLRSIFGTDLLADEAQIPGFLELLGVDAHKPWECVGEVEECVVALDLLRKSPEWQDEPVVKALADAVPASAWRTASHSGVFTPGGPAFVPETYPRVGE